MLVDARITSSTLLRLTRLKPKTELHLLSRVGDVNVVDVRNVFVESTRKVVPVGSPVTETSGIVQSRVGVLTKPAVIVDEKRDTQVSSLLCKVLERGIVNFEVKTLPGVQQNRSGLKSVVGARQVVAVKVVVGPRHTTNALRRVHGNDLR